MPTTTHDFSHAFIELGLAVVGLAVLARLANRWGFSAIPLYLLAGLAFGNGGLAPLKLTENFIHIGAEIGVLLLLCGAFLREGPEAPNVYFGEVLSADFAAWRGVIETTLYSRSLLSPSSTCSSILSFWIRNWAFWPTGNRTGCFSSLGRMR